jgi:hypothetical protein
MDEDVGVKGVVEISAEWGCRPIRSIVSISNLKKRRR